MTVKIGDRVKIRWTTTNRFNNTLHAWYMGVVTKFTQENEEQYAHIELFEECDFLHVWDDYLTISDRSSGYKLVHIDRFETARRHWLFRWWIIDISGNGRYEHKIERVCDANKG